MVFSVVPKFSVGPRRKRGNTTYYNHNHNKDIDMAISNHIRKLIAVMNRIGYDRIREMDEVHTTILHDEWCDFWNGRGPCNCDPVIEEISEDPPSSTR